MKGSIRGARKPRTVHFLQPYLAAYRVPFYERLAARMEDVGVDFRLHASVPSGAQAARNDAASAPWLTQTARHERIIANRSIYYRGGLLELSRDDVLVTELDVGNINAWRYALPSRSRPRPTIILWGHGRSYINTPSGAVDTARRWLLRAADGVATYTPAGAAAARLALNGKTIPIRSVGNSTDTVALQHLARSASRQAVEQVAENLGLTDRNVHLFVGGIDKSKRIDFLLSAASVAYRLDPSFVLIVAGSGVDEHAFDFNFPYLRRLSRATPKDMALLSHIAQSCWMPGRVGLVAVEMQALGLPLATTKHDHHAPELEFLRPDDEVVFLPNNEYAFAAAALHLVPRREARFETPIVSVEAMSDAFSTLILEAHAGRGCT